MLIYLVILLAVVSRFIPHIPNFAPITALAIFAAVYLPWKKAFGITFAARLVSDIFLGFVSWPMMVAIYASHLVGILFGVWIKSDARYQMPDITVKASFYSSQAVRDESKKRWLKIIASSLGASAIFFLVTNFAFLYSNYPHNFSGILEAYINGLPFLRGTLMGDMFYSVAMFGGYELAKFFVKNNRKSLAISR